jgi:hypothetical protein
MGVEAVVVRVPSVVVLCGRGPRRRRAALEEAEVYSEEDEEEFPKTFREQEAGLLPILVNKLADTIKDVPTLRPLLREDRFTDLLSKEADLRCAVHSHCHSRLFAQRACMAPPPVLHASCAPLEGVSDSVW